jgi:hypothetical protein
MPAKARSFKAVLGGKSGDRPVVEVPFDADFSRFSTS